MKCVHTFGTDRHKRQADITFLFEYILTHKDVPNQLAHFIGAHQPFEIE